MKTPKKKTWVEQEIAEIEREITEEKFNPKGNDTEVILKYLIMLSLIVFFYSEVVAVEEFSA